ncbi:NAD-dependent epimerase/dehydratase family protein [Paracoccus sp. 11-3]|uniref:NAD-dependent epimerase/dehydratase family protein n=1 Tax=Paracoccus amoyensis TaxID=2760093 RepID=A0A926GHR8_9RHOB|nr:NAD-dependent epimerase/dehydratase family protein [Paracoccus amoyensis]MBC9247549.1 NAD-dependent epimerase/dehydratase family protein [Paracoccus amoyensis]
MKLLIMGGSGFVGQAVVRALLTQGHGVTLLNRGNRPIQGTRQLVADRNDPDALDAALAGQSFDAVVDTNCYSGQQAATLIASLGGRTPDALVISSAAVYADAALHPPGEDAPVGGGSAWGDYGRDKTDVEEVYRNGGFRSGVALRPPYICGPNNDLDREAWFLRRIAAGRPVLVPGQGTAEYHFLHEDDLGAAVCRWLDTRPEGFASFNVADPQLVTAVQLPEMLAKAAGLPVDIRTVGDAAGTARPRDWYPFRDVHCAADPTRFIVRFGWAPANPLAERLAQIARHLSESKDTQASDWTPLEAAILSKLD